MKTFLDYFNDKSTTFTIYYVVNSKPPKVKESDNCAFMTHDNGMIGICRLPTQKGMGMRKVMHTAQVTCFGCFKEKDLDTTILKDNWNHTAKTAYLNKEDAEKSIKEQL